MFISTNGVVTARVRSMREGNVFSLSTRGRGLPHGLWSQVLSLVSGPRSFPGGGGSPVLVLARRKGEAVPQSGPKTEYPPPPPARTRTGSTPPPSLSPGQDQDRGMPLPLTRTRTGVCPSPLARTSMEVPSSPLLPPPPLFPLSTPHRQDTPRAVRLLWSRRRTFLF